MAFDFDRSERWGTRWVALIGLLSLVAVALVTICDVLLRWLFNSPIDGVQEVSRLMVAIAISSFFPVALAEHHHISIEFLGTWLGPRARLWIDTLAHLVTSAFFVVVGWQFVLYTMEVRESGETTWILGWKVAPWWTVTTIFMLICVPVQLVILYRQVRAAVRGDVPGPQPSEDLIEGEF